MPDETEGPGPETGSTPGVTRWRKRPVIVSAIQWTGTNLAEVQQFAGSEFADVPPEDRAEDPERTAEVWDKLHGTWVGVHDGQWVIKGVRGEFYPCDAGVLAETYEPAASPDPAGEVSVGEVRDLLARAGVPHAEDTHYAIVAAQHGGALIILTCCDGVDDVAGLLREGLAATTSDVSPSPELSNRVIVRADDLRKLLATPGAATLARDELAPVIARLSAAAEVTR